MPKQLSTQPKVLHILFTGLFLPKVLSGGDQLIFDIVPRLPKDLTITVIAPHFSKEHWSKVSHPKLTVTYLPPNRFEFKTNPLTVFLSYVTRSFQVAKILRSEPTIETIYSCSDVAYADIWPAYFLRGQRKNVKWLSRIYHVLLAPSKRKGSFISNAIAFYLQRLSFWMMKRRSTTVFALNDKLYHEVSALGFSTDKLAVLGAGIDYQAISDYKPAKTYDYDVVVLGRVAPVKGIYDVIKVWKTVHEKHPDLRLAWIGSGGNDMHEKITGLLKEDGLTDSFELLGFVDKTVAYDVLKSAKVFLCPDHENGWGLAVCEAMASGLPVVSYDLDIFGSVYQRGFVSVPLYDTERYTAQLLRLLEDPFLCKQMSKDALDQARTFDHDKVVKTLVKYL